MKNRNITKSNILAAVIPFIIIFGITHPAFSQKKKCQINPYMHLTEFKTFDDIPYPFEVKKVKLSETVELAYVDEGKGKETIIFVHGLGSYLLAWKKNVEELSKNYRCIAIDLPGYGKSSKYPHSGSMTFYAENIKLLVEKLNLGKVYIAGHSMGGQIAMTTALYYPEIVKGLILAAPAGFESFTKGQKQWLRNAMPLDAVKNTSVEAIQTNLHYNFFKTPEDAQFMITDRIAMRDAEGFNDYCYAVSQSVSGMVDEPIMPFLEKIKQPTLIFFGENDNLIPNRFLNPGFTRKIAEIGHKKLSNSSLIMLPKTGHFCMYESADKVNQAIKDFIK